MKKKGTKHIAGNNIIKVLLIVVFVILTGSVLMMINFFPFKTYNKDDAVDYRFDRQPLIERFPTLPDFIECYWKADTIGVTNFGPTSYWMTGFIIFDEDDETYKQLLDTYEWFPKESVGFSNGVEPEITNKKDFNWCHNADFKSETFKGKFIGELFLDTNNGVLYFDVENL